MHTPPVKVIPARDHPLVRQLVEWVRAERDAQYGWLQKNKLPKGKFNELFERAFVRFPGAAKFSEEQIEFIRSLINRKHRLL